MKKINYTTRLVIVLVSASCLLVSCSHYYYAPNTNNVPLLKEKNDGKVNLNYYSTSESGGFEFQGAYAAGKHTGIMLNFVTASSNNDLDVFGSGSDGGKGIYLEAAAGYFSPIKNSKWVFETYSGIGIGSITNEYGGPSSITGITKVFTQPSIGLSIKGFEFALSSRFSYVNLNIRNSTVKEMEHPEDYYDIAYIRAHRSSILWEPGITLRGGFKGVMFQVAYTNSVNLQHNWKQELDGLSFGICIPFKVKPE